MIHKNTTTYGVYISLYIKQKKTLKNEGKINAKGFFF